MTPSGEMGRDGTGRKEEDAPMVFKTSPSLHHQCLIINACFHYLILPLLSFIGFLLFTFIQLHLKVIFSHPVITTILMS